MAVGKKWCSASISFGLVTTWLAPLDTNKSMSSGSALPVMPNTDATKYNCNDWQAYSIAAHSPMMAPR